MELKELLKFKDSFVQNCCSDNRVKYEPRGILNIEAFYWWSLVGHYKPDIILESGVFMGRSTEVLSRAQKFFQIPQYYAFDKDPTHEQHVRKKIAGYDTVYKITGSHGGFESVLSANKGKKYLAIMDGPKGNKPMSQLIDILHKYGNCCALASHDCMPSSKIPALFVSVCKKLFPKGKTVITAPADNMSVADVNNCIVGDMKSYYDGKLGREESAIKVSELLDRSNYVGICFCS